MWCSGASHNHCTCRFAKGVVTKGLISCDVMNSWTWIFVMTLCWTYLFLYDIHMIQLMFIWTYVDDINVDLIWWWCCSCVEYLLILSYAMSIGLSMFLIVNKRLLKWLTIVLNKMSFESWFQWFYLQMIQYLVHVVVLTDILSLFP